MTLLTKNDRIFVAGHRGLVGSALLRTLAARGYPHLFVRTHAELDLLDGVAVRRYFAATKPDVVFLAAAKVGGIRANETHRADFIQQNLAIQGNVIGAAHLADVRRLVFLGSSCVYPRDAAQPITEAALMTGPLEMTNRAYAIAKIAGLELVHSLRLQYGRDYFSVMPTNLFGSFDNFDLETAHVLPALLRRFHAAAGRGDAEVRVWGTGTPLREFLYSDDCADALVFLAESLPLDHFKGPWSHLNVGSGTELSIATLARTLADATGFTGTVGFDRTKPDGTPRKFLDSSALQALGWRAPTPFVAALKATVAWYIANGAPVHKLKGAS